MKAQAAEDPDYLNYGTAQDLIQSYGRPNRSNDDFSETFIIDDQIEAFLIRYSGRRYDRDHGRFMMNSVTNNKQKFFPDYFLEAFQRVPGVTDPPPLESL